MIDKLSSTIIRLEDGPEEGSLLCLPDCLQDSEGMHRRKNLELQAREALLCCNQSVRGHCGNRGPDHQQDSDNEHQDHEVSQGTLWELVSSPQKSVRMNWKGEAEVVWQEKI